jgi:PAS domain S-box-containing protein
LWCGRFSKGFLLRLRPAGGTHKGVDIRRKKPRMSSDDAYEVALAALERSEAILENVGDGVFSTDPRSEILLWNRSAQRVIGCSPNKARGAQCADVLGLRVGDLPLDCSDGCALLRLTEGREPGTSVEVTRTGDDGRPQPLLMNVTAIKDVEGNVSEVVHSMRDITALKLADEAKTMFLATASHELKTPLTVILGFTQALRADWLDDNQRKDALGSIERRAQELAKIVDRLLLTGRIESGKIRLELGVVDICELVPERAKSLAMVTGRSIPCDLPADCPPAIADREAITTILDHLLDNAVKYSPDGGDIGVRVVAHRSGVEIEVSDPGIGMNEEGAARCFERFWQAETSDVRRFGGTGVGLYIVRSLVEGMGGVINVRSMLGKGTTFTVRLRRASEADLAGKVKPPTTAEPGVGKRTMIHEFMHQIGVPGGGGGGGGGS